MKTKIKTRKTQLLINESVEGESIEYQMERILNNGDLDIVEQKEIKYTNPDDGVIAITDIRADKFELAIEQNEKILESERGRLEERRKKREEEIKKKSEEKQTKNDADGVTGQPTDGGSKGAD